ncbi:hypothetical protein [Leucobacter ruminantium]|uniref:Lipoprotein n=1 Tax=Leucobacter ruminantium TaxID=1289170 RepID=A0A939LX79_9MICO|nr:hypothetical protein [Leucobacter ruminantium]MBO1804598.1 hypothetical protein [Leucobacter ruminantium]
MDERTVFLLVITVLSLGALGCFSAALYFWAAQGGHLRAAERLERRAAAASARPARPSSSAPAAHED